VAEHAIVMYVSFVLKCPIWTLQC